MQFDPYFKKHCVPIGTMSEENICKCEHLFYDHGYEKNENPPPHMLSPCKKCECKCFVRPGTQEDGISRARRKQDKQEAQRKAEERLEEQRKEQQHLERLEEQRKEQQHLERLDKERLETEQYRYQELFHICHIDNLPSIIEKGLFSRINAQQNLHGFNDIANLGIVTDRRVGLTTFASTYFEPINAMYIKKKQDDECGINNIVVVGFDLDLQNSEMVFYDGNAATGKTVKTNYYDHSSFVKIMSEIQKETIEIEYKGHGQWPGRKEDPAYKEHYRRKQAECLVPNKISRDCITSIHVYKDEESKTAATRIIDNSGLRIRLETLDKYQKSIKRREH